MLNVEMKRNMRDTSDRCPLLKACREVRYLIGKDRLRRRCPEIYTRGIGTTIPSFEQVLRTVKDVEERQRASKAKLKCWVTESKCRAGCNCQKEVYRGPEGLGAYQSLSARRTGQNPRTRAPRLLLHLHPPQAQALAQGLEGDLLILDLDQRQFGEGGSWGRQGENAARWIEMRGCFEDQADVALVGSLCSWGNLVRPIRVSGWGTAAARKCR
ncbi:predicted protein [Postia placenta Mad-698-R]|nr:predicted protein [Postia placenta Mad-698-R]